MLWVIVSTDDSASLTPTKCFCCGQQRHLRKQPLLLTRVRQLKNLWIPQTQGAPLKRLSGGPQACPEGFSLFQGRPPPLGSMNSPAPQRRVEAEEKETRSPGTEHSRVPTLALAS